MLIEIFLIAIATSLLAIAGGIFKYRNSTAEGSPTPTPPGPFRWPIVGNLVLFQRLSREHGGQHRAFLELSRLYSSNLVSLRLGRSNVIAVSGYREIRTILGADQFDGRPWNEFSRMRNMGLRKGITMSDGPEWREVRAWLVRTLRKIGFGRAEMTACIGEESELVLDSVKDGGIYRMRKLLAPAMVNVIWTLATGKRIADKEKLDNFIRLMERRAKAFDMAGGLLSLFPWLRHVAPVASGYKLLVTLNNEIRTLLMAAIEEHKNDYAAGYIGGGQPDDLIYMFFEEMHNNGNKRIFNEEQLFMILLDLLIAGSVTTTTTLDFLFLRMTVHPDIQRKLHEELDSVIGRDRPVNLNDRPNLPYVEAVLTESQRMQMVAPIVGPRRATRDSCVDGYRIPEGSFVLLNVWSVHMNPEYYPNPDVFDPERFINKDGAYVPDEKLIFFGRGHRRCPCEADARSALFLFFVGIMQRFELLAKPGEKPPDTEPNFGMTISPKPYQVLLVPRQILR